MMMDVTIKTVTLADFLLARIAEDEQEWIEGALIPPLSGEWRGVARRILAECAAKRRIIESGRNECGETVSRREDPEFWAELDQSMSDVGVSPAPHWPDGEPGYPCDGCAAAEAADHDRLAVLRILATVYAGHPDYRDEWRL